MLERPIGHSNLNWRTSLSCNSGACVQVAASGEEILIADTKSPDGPFLAYSIDEFREFITGAKNGDFDDLIR